MAPVVSLEQPQHMVALAKAQQVRMAGVRIKRDLKAGRITIAQALVDPDAASLSVFDLLIARPRWGRKKAVNFLVRHQISETRRVRNLTARQRTMLTEACSPTGMPPTEVQP